LTGERGGGGGEKRVTNKKKLFFGAGKIDFGKKTNF